MFATRLKVFRKDKGKTQADMAIWLGVLRSTYGEYEREIITPQMDKIKTLDDYFGVSVDYLMRNTNIKTRMELLISSLQNSMKMAQITNKKKM